MAFARASAVRTAVRLARSTRPALPKPQTWQRIGRRSYASGGHDAVKSSSDLPWLISSVAVSGVGSFFLLTGEKPKAHGDHDAHHSEKHEEHEEKEEASTDSEESASSGDEPKEDSKDEEEVKEDSKEEKTEDSSSDSEGDGADTPDTSDDEVVGEDETNVKKIIPDAKGGNKKRLESKNSIKQGEEKDTADSPVKDKAASSKEAGDKSTTSGKQEGLSNTDTKHSTDAKDEEHSTKGEGTPETAKSKGTVDPKRPQDKDES